MYKRTKILLLFFNGVQVIKIIIIGKIYLIKVYIGIINTYLKTFRKGHALL